MKNSWLGSGRSSRGFSRLPAVRGVLLNEWEAERAIVPERCYKSPKGKPPIRYTTTHCNFFPCYPLDGYSKDFQEKLKRAVERHKEFAERPATYGAVAKTPRLLDPNFRGVVPDQVPRSFGWGKHTSWEGFRKMFLGKLRPDLAAKSQTALHTARSALQ
eukprot:TRINITY_DN2153_c0_g1_i10.p2 TRINITY_DN2153_c0_g1~~TRINITY_DN2153_c0_g1_i10.p2  ORF type:complete len:159 (+),score=30.69 TRINITY_DN2153_c0_g1_i10:1068-1544(+)